MSWYLELVLYLVGLILSFTAFWFVDFNKFVRIGKKQYAIFIYVVISLALGFLIGKFFITIGTLLPHI